MDIGMTTRTLVVRDIKAVTLARPSSTSGSHHHLWSAAAAPLCDRHHSATTKVTVRLAAHSRAEALARDTVANAFFVEPCYHRQCRPVHDTDNAM